MIKPVPHVAVMTPYLLADLKAGKGKRVISLSQNESFLPPSPLAIAAAADAMADVQLYPDPDWVELRKALADLHNLAPEEILCGNGSMELIASLAQTFADGQNAILAPAHAYPFFRTAAQRVQARFDTAPEKSGRVSVSALLKAVQPDTRLVFVANPGNPTGTRISRGDLQRLREGLRDDILLVIDEAYGEFADHLKEPVFDMVARGDTVVLRTFSKAYGLAGMRVGWGVFPASIAKHVRKVMNPNNISKAGQAAACAAVKDHAYMRATCQRTTKERDGFIRRLQTAGFNVDESFTNFALIRFGSPEAANRAEMALRTEGVFLRAQGGAALPDCLRVTMSETDNINLAAALLIRWAKEEQI